jgi:hypothetical protein
MRTLARVASRCYSPAKVDPTMVRSFHMNRDTRAQVVTRVAVFAACLAIVASGAESTARAQTSGEEDLNRRGIELRKSGNDAAARGVFQEMYDRFRSPRSAAQLGLAEQAVGRWEDAEAHVSEALRSPSDPWVAKHRAPLDQAIIAIRAHVARVEISGDPVGAEVLINGRSVGKLPLPRSITVPIGQVDVECRAPGHKTAVRTLSLGAADYQRVFIRMEKEAGEAAMRRAASVARADPSASGAEPDVPGDKDGAADAGLVAEHASGGAAAGADTARTGPSSARSAIKWTSLGLAVAGLGTGIAGSFVREQQVSTFRSTNSGNCRDNGGRGVDPTGAPVAACQGPLDAQKTATIFQIAGFVGAGVFAVTWLVLQLTEPDTGEHGAATEARGGRDARAPALAAWQCAPSLFPQSPSVSCALTF